MSVRQLVGRLDGRLVCPICQSRKRLTIHAALLALDFLDLLINFSLYFLSLLLSLILFHFFLLSFFFHVRRVLTRHHIS